MRLRRSTATIKPHGTPREWLRFNFPRQEGRRRLCISRFLPRRSSRRSTTCSACSSSPSATRPPSWPSSFARQNRVPGLSLPPRLRRRIGRGAGGVLAQAHAAGAGLRQRRRPDDHASSSSRNTAAAGTASAIPPARIWKTARMIVELLQPEEIGVTLSENFMLVPEQIDRCDRRPSSAGEILRRVMPRRRLCPMTSRVVRYPRVCFRWRRHSLQAIVTGTLCSQPPHPGGHWTLAPVHARRPRPVHGVAPLDCAVECRSADG